LQELRRAVIRGLPDPVGDITREKLRGITRYIPVVYDGAPMRDAFRIAVELLNIAQLNVQYGAVVGTGVLGGDCADAFNSVGVSPYTNPQANSNQVVTIEDTVNNLKYVRVFNQAIPENEARTVTVNVDEFVGTLETLTIDPAGGFGDPITHRVNRNITLPDGTNFDSSVSWNDTATDNRNFTVAAFGRGDVGADAFAFDPLTFSKWDGSTNNLPTEINQTPIPGTTSLDIQLSMDTGRRALSTEVWLVCDIAGSVEVA